MFKKIKNNKTFKRFAAVKWIAVLTVVVGLGSGGVGMAWDVPNNENTIVTHSPFTGIQATGYVDFYDGNNSSMGWVGFGSQQNNILYMLNNSTNGDIALMPKGKVGILTEAPIYPLHVNGRICWGGISNYAFSGIDSIGLFIENYGKTLSVDNIRIQTSRGGDCTNYSTFTIDPSTGFSFKKIGTANSNITVAGTTTSTSYACSSDLRWKKNLTQIQGALQKVLGLRGVNYFWKVDEYKDKGFTREKQIGFVAQEVEKIMPELVRTDKEGYKTMSYDRVTALLVEAVKELKTQSDAKIFSLEKENAQLKNRLASLEKLEQRMAALEKATSPERPVLSDAEASRRAGVMVGMK